MSEELKQQRLNKLEQLRAAGVDPYGAKFTRRTAAADCSENFREGRAVRVAGRVFSLRGHGKSVFADLRDATGRIQLYFRRDRLGEGENLLLQCLDRGDFIGAGGKLFHTRTGEVTVQVEEARMLSKSLLPLPEKWHGLKDRETRYRRRYLDLLVNEESREVFQARGRAIRVIRRFLEERGYVEVETPMLQSLAGGAAARPFRTRYEALDTDVFLRIAPELFLKRLLVGGYEKVFELNRNFRNEGLSRFHNPEFTMLEVYEAFGDARTMMELVGELIVAAAREVGGGLVRGEGEGAIDLTPPWREVRYRELVMERAGGDWFEISDEGRRARAESFGLEIPPEWGEIEITREVFEKTIEKTLRAPTFVTRLPAGLVPLAKPCADDPDSADVFELIIGGLEIAPGYTELNDPLEQLRRFQVQAAGDLERIDEDFLTALEHGMPPAGGMGVGIDRLVMILTGAAAVRDVILFPQLKPRKE